MAKMSCLVAKHKTLTFDDEEHCITCLENEITRLRAYVQRGRDLLFPLAGNREVNEYRQRAEEVLKETLSK